jgi:Cell division protein FtsQ
VAGSRKKKTKAGSGWTWRLAGIALCAFFVLGVITGLSQSGRVLARRIETLLQHLPHGQRSELIPTAYHALFSQELSDGQMLPSAAASLDKQNRALALIKRTDGFYEIDNKGVLLGPVSAGVGSDLPILSGSGVEHARASQLVEYAGELIRAEAVLAALVSEMLVTANDEIRLYLDRPQLVIVLSPQQFRLQLALAARVLELWPRQLELIGTVDMTIPGEAIVRPDPIEVDQLDHPRSKGRVRVAGLSSFSHDRGMGSEKISHLTTEYPIWPRHSCSVIPDEMTERCDKIGGGDFLRR